MNLPRTLGELTKSSFSEQRLRTRKVKDELRENLIARLRSGETIFPGIIGYEDTVVPQLVNAVLSRHNFILLGLRGQAKSRILRALTALLDPQLPYVAGCEIHDNPYEPICKRCRELIAREGGNTPIGLIVLSPFAKPGYAGTIPYTHSSLLRTVQDVFGLRPFMRDAANATSLDDLFVKYP